MRSYSIARDGSPVIFPDQMACHLCEDFPCIAACETDALLPVDSPRDVRMGLAVVSQKTCTAGQGCHACVSQCPTEALSMDFDTLRLVVASGQCVGCGLCEQICKTVNDRLAIKVTPIRHSSLRVRIPLQIIDRKEPGIELCGQWHRQRIRRLKL